MKHVFTISLLLFAGFAFAQSIEEIDTSNWTVEPPEITQKYGPAVPHEPEHVTPEDIIAKHDYVNARRSTTWCATDAAWEMRRNKLGLEQFDKMGCPTEGACDTPAVRDATVTGPKTINIYVHLLRNDDGTGGVDINNARAAYNTLVADYASSNISFNLVGAQWINDSTYAVIPPYSPFNNNWYNAIQNLKQSYAIYPRYVCNIFVTGQQPSGFGTLLGIATFPWDPAADTKAGGLWLNNISVTGSSHTWAHELGHCFGLWHTHHGVSEVGSCSNCYEYASGVEGDIRGDFCSDTPPTPTNYACSGPGGSDCQGTPWGTTQPENYMGYGPDSCMNLFTAQQTKRMHCWVPDALPLWVQ